IGNPLRETLRGKLCVKLRHGKRASKIANRFSWILKWPIDALGYSSITDSVDLLGLLLCSQHLRYSQNSGSPWVFSGVHPEKEYKDALDAFNENNKEKVLLINKLVKLNSEFVMYAFTSALAYAAIGLEKLATKVGGTTASVYSPKEPVKAYFILAAVLFVMCLFRIKDVASWETAVWELNVPKGDIEQLLVSLILDSQIQGHSDQVNKLSERSDSSKEMRKYTTVEKWITQLKSLYQTIGNKVSG
ncbi:hypothetical protein Dimus_013899, partial [Dionaea muscipula]